MKKLIIGVDGGGYEGKVAGPHGALSFRTNLAPWRELKVLDRKHGDDDMIFDVDGEKGLAGTIALNESRISIKNRYGISKAHNQAKIRVLLGIFRYLEKFNINSADSICVITGQPVDGHTEDDKNTIKNNLVGPHTVTVNKKTREFYISEVGVAPEGTGGFWGSNQEKETCRIFDFGSGNVNLVSIKNFIHINSTSKTLNYGTEVLPPDEVMHSAIDEAIGLGWTKDDEVLVCGGSASRMLETIREEFPKAELLIPTLVLDKGSAQILEPKFANAVGFYIIGKGKF